MHQNTLEKLQVTVWRLPNEDANIHTSRWRQSAHNIRQMTKDAEIQLLKRALSVLRLVSLKLRYTHHFTGLVSALQCFIKYRSTICQKKQKHWSFAAVSPVCFKANASEARCWCKKALCRKEEVVGGISYSSVFKTGLEKKEEKRANHRLLISLPLKESFSPASSGPANRNSVYY